MPKATPAQRRRFGEALRRAMRMRPGVGEDGIRDDVWLAERVGLTAQAIRNYVSGVREPKNADVVERIEDALALERHWLGRHLGYGSLDLDELLDRVDGLPSGLPRALGSLGAGAQVAAASLTILSDALLAIDDLPVDHPRRTEALDLLGRQAHNVRSIIEASRTLAEVTGLLDHPETRQPALDILQAFDTEVIDAVLAYLDQATPDPARVDRDERDERLRDPVSPSSRPRRGRAGGKRAG